MRSLWRRIAARWLGGQGSDALAGDSALLDLIDGARMRTPPAFQVSCQSEVSHRAMMSPPAGAESNFEAAAAQRSRAGPSR